MHETEGKSIEFHGNSSQHISLKRHLIISLVQYG